MYININGGNSNASWITGVQVVAAEKKAIINFAGGNITKTFNTVSELDDFVSTLPNLISDPNNNQVYYNKNYISAYTTKDIPSDDGLSVGYQLIVNYGTNMGTSKLYFMFATSTERDDFTAELNVESGGGSGGTGAPGKDGFSPIVTVKTNTDTEYVLEIQTKSDGTKITTPNLKGGGSGGAMQIVYEGTLESTTIPIAELMTSCGDIVDWDMLDETCIIFLQEVDTVVGLAYITAVNKTLNTITVNPIYFATSQEITDLKNKLDDKQDKLTAGNGVEITADNVVNVDTSKISMDGYVTDDKLEETVETLTNFNRINPNNMVRIFDGNLAENGEGVTSKLVTDYEAIVFEKNTPIMSGYVIPPITSDINNIGIITGCDDQTSAIKKYMAFNQDNSNYFAGNATDGQLKYLQIEFPEAKSAVGVYLRGRGDEGATYIYINNFHIKVSDDGVNWENIYSYTKMDEVLEHEIRFNSTITKKFWRIEMPTVTGSGNNVVNNILLSRFDLIDSFYNTYQSYMIGSRIGTHVVSNLGLVIDLKDDKTFTINSLNEADTFTGIYGLTKESTSGAASVGEAHDLTPQVDGVKTVFDIDSSILEEYNKSLYYSGLLMNETYDYTIDYTNNTLTTTFVPNSEEERRLVLLVDDNTSSGGGSGGGAIATKEIINPFTFDGVETTFDISSLNVNSKSKVYINGLRIINTIDFNLVGTDIVFTTAWDNTDSCLLEVEEV